MELTEKPDKFSILEDLNKTLGKSAYGPMWSTRPELIPVSVA